MNKQLLAAAAAVAFCFVVTADQAEAGHRRGLHIQAGGVHVDIGRPHSSFHTVAHHGGHHGGWGWGGCHGSTWHNTSHYDWHPGSIQWHGNHFDYTPGHWDYHNTGHWDHH